MEAVKLKKLVSLLLLESGNYRRDLYVKKNKNFDAKIRNLLDIASKSLPNHITFFKKIYYEIDKDYSSFDIKDAQTFLQDILNLIDIEQYEEEKIIELKIFDSAYEKLKQAANYFQKEDYSSASHHLNSSLELILRARAYIYVFS